MSTSDLDVHLREWQPDARRAEDPLTAGPARALAAVLDEPDTAVKDGDPLPALWHWLYFLTWPARRELGEDGHPAEGHFLPPIPSRRRMFAGGRLEVVEPLVIGQPAERVSRLADTAVKRGRSGEMLFVTERHEIRQGGRLCVVEETDLVYRSGEPATGATVPQGQQPASTAPWQQPLVTDPVLLFRFSALTANAHRIHYDEAYTCQVEGYPGLVVHGPLLVLLMAGLVRRHAPGQTVATMSFRLRRPLFVGIPALATGEPDGPVVRLAMLAGAETCAQAEVRLGESTTGC